MTVMINVIMIILTTNDDLLVIDANDLIDPPDK